MLVDDETRHRLGATSFKDSAAYNTDVIVREWEQLIADLR